MLACQWSGWREISVEYIHTISILHIFYHLCSKYDNLPTFTYHVYLRVGDIERAWLTRSVAPNTLIQLDFYTFLADNRTTIQHWSYLARFRSILLHVNVCASYIYTLFIPSTLVSGRGQLAYLATVYGYHGNHSGRPVFYIK